MTAHKTEIEGEMEKVDAKLFGFCLAYRTQFSTHSPDSILESDGFLETSAKYVKQKSSKDK